MPLEIHKLLSILLMGQSLTIMLTSCRNSDSSSSLVNILGALNITTPYHYLTDDDVPHESIFSTHSNHPNDKVNILKYHQLHSSSNRKRFRRTPPGSFTGDWLNRLPSDQRINWDDFEAHSNIDLLTYQMTGRNSPKHEIKKWGKRETSEIKWPNKRTVSVEGEVVIGGLMMVHSRGNGSQTCGQIMGQGGVQALEVMLYTLQEINKNKSNPFTVGAHILDDCDTDTYGLAMALDFIKSESIRIRKLIIHKLLIID